MATGFTTTDPLANDLVGYRSHKVARKEAGQMLAGSDVSYNGFVFPPQIQAKATVVPEYNDAKTSIKWYTIVLSIEAYITQYDVDDFAAANPTIDPQMDNIRARLMQPCQALSFTLQGFGTVAVQAPSETFFPSAAQSQFVYDVNYGPKPQVLEWSPLGGAVCAKIQWLVTTCIPPCGPEGVNNGLNGILDLAYEVRWSLPDAGFLRRSVNGKIELAATRLANAGSIHASNNIDLLANKQQYEAALTHVRRSFPPLEGYEREEDFGVSKDRRVLTFSFSDSQIPSPQAYPAGFLKSSLEESVGSTAADAFHRWDWGISGSISVPNSTNGTDIVNNKRLAFAAFGMIVRDRLDRINGLKYKTQTESATNSASELIEKEHKVTAIPRSLRVTNEILGNGISVDIQYSIICDPMQLWRAIGFFDKFNDSGINWKKWRDFIELGGSRIPVLDIIPNQEFIVDLCHPLVTPQTSFQQPSYNSFGSSLLYPRAPEEDSSWISYENKFEVETDYGTTATALLSEFAGEIQRPANVENPKEERALQATPLPPSASESYQGADLHTASDPVSFVRMIGRATRIGYPINAPVLEGVSGQAAISYGKDKIIPASKPSGFTDPSGNTVNVYHLQWNKSYVLRGIPDRETVVKASGQPQFFG
jgi:hypothetical protein